MLQRSIKLIKELLTILFFFIVTFYLSENVVNAAKVGDTTDFPDSGEYTFEAPATGYYQLEAWGAQGGSYNTTYRGGYGGYSTGVIHLTKGQIIYINVGKSGGFASKPDTVTYSYSGGEMTAISLTKWSSEINDDNIILIAGGGGGAFYRNDSNKYVNTGTGGSGGGIIGERGYATTRAIFVIDKYAQGGTQNAGGAGGQYHRSDMGGLSNASNGTKFHGASTGYGGYGGDGYYGGGAGGFGGGAGGSGYIGNPLLLSYKEITKIMYGYGVTESSASDTRTIATSSVDGNAISTYAKTGNGAARIRIIELTKTNSKLASLTTSVGIFNVPFNPNTYVYDIVVGSEEYKIDVEGTVQEETSKLIGNGTYELKTGKNIIYLTVTADSGDVSIYTLNITRPASSYRYLSDIKIDGASINGFNPTTLTYNITVDYDVETLNLEAIYGRPSQSIYLPNDLSLNSGNNTLEIVVVSEDGLYTTTYTLNVFRKHSSLLKSLSFGIFTIDFDPTTFEYTIDAMSSTMSLEVNAIPYDEEAKIKVEGLGYIKTSTTGTITVTEPNCSPTVYKIKVVKDNYVGPSENDFPYTGEFQTFEAPTTGYYRLEAWGAQGGSYNATYRGGYGAYSTGVIRLNKGQIIYINVGKSGSFASKPDTVTYSYSGGELTAISLTQWSSQITDDNIILIAGGGGGAFYRNDSNRYVNTGTGGSGGGIIGERGYATTRAIFVIDKYAQGGTQNAGGAGGQYHRSDYGGLSNASNGTKFHGASTGYGGYGGDGYYGGGAGGFGGGAGGSSYIANEILFSYREYTKAMYGYGAVTSNEENTYTVYTDKYSSTPISNYAKGGNGHVRITLLPPPSENNFLSALSIKATDSILHETVDKTYTPDFNTEEEDYYVDFDSKQTVITLSARPEDSRATIEGLGEFEVPAGGYDDNIFEIKVTAEAGNEKIYKVHVKRDADTNPYPNDIIISGLVPSLCSKDTSLYCNLNPTKFDKDTNTYYLTVPSRIKQLWFDVEKGHPYQVVNGEGKVSLAGGTNNVTISITSESGVLDGTGSPSSVYNYVIIRDMTGNTDLSFLSILDSGPKEVRNPDGSIKKDEDGNPIIEYGFDLHFDPDVMEYYLTIPNSYTDYVDLEENKRDASITNKLQLYIETDDENASYFINPGTPADFETGMNDLYVTVTAANGEIRTYILHIYREQNENTYISNIEVKNGTTNYPLAPIYNKANLGPYNVTVPNDVDNVDIIATAEVSTTHIEGTGNKQLNTGLNKFELVSVAENNTKEKYYVYITREKNSNPYLANLEAFIGTEKLTLTPNNNPFDKTVLSYEVEVPIGTSEIKIVGTPEVGTTTVKYLDNNQLKVGNTKKRIMTIAEDGTSLTYEITFIRPADENNYLSDIILSEGTLNPNNNPFDKTVQEYTIEVENEVSSINITGIKENVLSTVKGNGKYSLVVGENEILLTVIAENGNDRIYKLTVTRKPNSNAYLSNITTSEDVIVTNHTTLNYTLNIGANVNKITLKGIPEAKTTKVTPSTLEIATPTYGDYNVSFVTLAEDGVTTLTYNVTIKKAKSNNANALSIIMEEGAIKPTFDKNKTTGYTAKVARSVESGTFHVTPEDPRSTYKITGNNFDIGENTVTVTIIAEDGTEKDYVIIVTRQELTSNYLLGINVKGIVTNENYEFDQPFSKEQQYYEIQVPYLETKVNVTATLEDIDADIKGIGVYSLDVGDNLVVIEVTSLDGKSRTYQIKINRKASSDARLSSVNIDGVLLSPSFDKNTFTYNASTTDTSLNFKSIVPVETKATYEIIGNNFTTNGTHEVIIRVTAPDGETKLDYIFNVEKLPSNNNNLSNLRVIDFEIQPTYVKNKTIYTLTVPNNTNNIVVEAIPEDPNATVSGDGSYTLNVGENEIVVEVTSESGKTKSYVIIVTKEGSNNNNLDNLVVTNGVMTPTFDGRTTYSVVVPYEEESLDLEVTLADDTATYTIEDNILKVGSNNQVKVLVTAENGDKKTYTLNVTRKEIVSALLKNLKFEGYELTPTFNSNIPNYDLTIDNEINEFIDIKNYTNSDASDISKKSMTIETLDKNATYVVSGNSNLVVGTNTITITVTSSDNSTTETYTVNINKQTYSSTFLDYLYTSEGDVSPLFNKYVMEYSIDVPNHIDKIELYGETEDASATVTNVCNPSDTVPCTPHELKVGTNKIVVTVTTTSNITRKYYVTVNRAASDLNYLETLVVKVNGETKTLTPEFVKTTNSYTLDVPIGTEFINLTGTISPLATVTGLGTINLVGGTNELLITVTSQSGIPNIYKLTVNREQSTNNHAIDIIPSVGALEPSFSYEETDYTINLDSSAAFLSFEVLTEDTNAKVTGNESKVIPDGTSTRVITITAEDGSKRTYTITVNKERSDNSLLSNLYVIGYPFEAGTFADKTYDATFDPENYEYHITVPNSKKVLLPSEVVAVTQDKNAKVTKANNLSLLTTQENVFIVTVTAPDGFTKQDYKIYITREQNNEALLTNLVVNVGFLTTKFNPNVYEYEWKIPKNAIITDASVTATASDPNATIIKTEYLDMTGEEPYIFEVMIISEDGKNSVTYRLNVTYDLSIDTTLASLTVDKGYYEPTFNPDTHTYHVYEYVDEEDVTVTAVPNAPTSDVISGNGLVLLPTPTTNHTIEVQAEDKSVDYYYLVIHKTILKDEGLLNLGLNGLDDLDCSGDKCILDPTFTTDGIAYSIKVPYEYENLDVLIEKMNDQQTVKLKIGDSYIENYKLPLGKTELFVEVYDGMNKLTRTYKMNIERCKSTNNYLKELSVKDYPFTENFDKTVMEYTINVGADVDEIPLDTITAIPEDPDARVGFINGYNYLMAGNNDITIPVYAADGSERTYIIHVVKFSEYSSYIRNITVSTGIFWDLTPKFKQTTYDYTTTVDSMYGKATVEAIPALPNTKIEGTGEYDLVTGVNTVTLTAYATDDDGNILYDSKGNPRSKSVYTIRIIKKESTDVDLINLIVAEGTLLKADTLEPGFDRTITKYVVSVPATIEKATIIPTLSDKTSTYKILGNEKLKSGENIVSVVVYNSTKTASKTYQIIINRAKDDIKTLSKLEVQNVDDNTINYPFTSRFIPENSGEYEVIIPHDIEKVNVVASTTSPNAFVFGDGLTYLEYGVNKKTVTVTAESGDVKTYFLNLYREYNLNLKLLISDVGTLVKTSSNEEGFDPSVTDYIINVDKDTERIVFIAQPESNKVTVEGSGEYPLTYGDNPIKFTVKSPDGHEKVYTVVVKRAKDENNYIAELIVNGLMSPVYNKEITSYDVNVRESITTGEVPNTVTTETTKLGIQKVKLESNLATCKIVGPAELINTIETDIDCKLEATGTLQGVDVKNEVKITVTAQSGATKDYILNVYRRESSFFSNRITALKISTTVNGETVNVPYNPDFNPDYNTYAARVANSISLVNIEFTREDEYSTFEIFKDGVSYGQSGNNIPLNPGRNAISIVVRSSDGLTWNTYQVIIYRTESSDATLKSLVTTGYSYSPIFSAGTTQYTMEVSGSVESIPVIAVPNDPNATVTISGNNFLKEGENTITIHVTAPDGITTKDYYITVNKVKSDNNFLTDLEVVDYPFEREFNKNNQGPYVVNVPSNVNNIVIKATTEDPNAIITGDGAQTLATGENVFSVDIEAPNGDYRTYTIIVNKAASTDSSLKDIIVSDGELDPVFNPGILYYEVLVPEELEQITVTGITNDPLSKIEGNGTYEIEDLETEIKLVVTSEDGNKTTYTVKVIRDVQSISTLKELILKDGEIYPKFHKLITSYTILVPYETRSFSMDSEPFNMIYTPEDPEATVVVSGNTNFRIGSNKMTIEVTSKDGQSVTEYVVSVVRQSAASNYLKSLEVKNVDETISYKMTPVFTKENLYYEVTVPMDVESIKIKAALDDLTSTLSGTGTKYLNVGINRFYVTVESASGIIRSYQIVINRAESTENKLLTLTYDVGVISPEFDPETNDYVITVPEKTTEITLDGTASPNSTIIGLGTFPVVAGEQTKIITVTSQSGDNNIYTVKIIRPASSNTNLISLTPSAGTIDFDNDKDEYEIEVDDNVSVISFTAVPEDPDATVTGLDLTTLTYGENEVTITVTAEDGTTTRDIVIKIEKSKRLNSITASEDEILLAVDEYMDISYTLDPTDTSETEVIWRSNDDSIATVDQNGRIIGKKIGSTQVVVMSATNNNIYDTIIVNVINKRIISDVYDIRRFEDEETESDEDSEEEQDEKIPHVIGLEPSTKLSDFIPNFENDPLTLHVFDVDGNELIDSELIVASFMTIKLIINDTVYDELAIIVRGDLNGDGYVTVTDYVKMKNYFLGKADFNYLENCAAEVSGDEYVTVTDYVKMKNYFIGKITTLN